MYLDPRKVCIECFSDSVLREFVNKHGALGSCDFCDSEDVKTVPIIELSEMFRNVADCYDEIEGPDSYLRGETLSFLLQDDWDIFSDKVEEDDALLQEMTLAILLADTEPKERVDFPDYDGFFTHQEPDLVFEWFDKLDEIINLKSSHHLIGNAHELHDLPGRIELAIEEGTRVFDAGDIYFRARIHKDRQRTERLTLSEMRAPPPKYAKSQRANREGEPALYLATDYQTALSEVRSWRGMAVAVAQMRLKRDIRVLDLIEVHNPQSPFDSEYLSYDLQVIGLLESFGSALSHPLLPGEEKSLYKPSQKLCDFVRQRGVEAILYPSAMGAGNNLVVFNPDDFEPVSIEYYRIGIPEFSPEIIHDTDDLYEEWPYAIYDLGERHENGCISIKKQ